MTQRLAFAFILFFYACGSGSSIPDGMTTVSTLESIGIQVKFSSLKSDSAPYVQFKTPGESSWHRGVNLVRNIKNENGDLSDLWVGSLFHLTAGETYDLQVLDRNDKVITQGTATCENWVWPEDQGNRYFVAASGCSDSSSGSEMEPWCTLQHAHDVAIAGDTIFIQPGTYYQQADFSKSGTEAKPISIVGNGAGVIFDGSDPTLLNTTWTSEGANNYSISLSQSPWLVVMDDERLFNFESFSDFQNGVSWSNDFWNTSPITSGWIYNSGKLYVRLPDSSNPSTHTMHINMWSTNESEAHALRMDDSEWLSFRNLQLENVQFGIHIKNSNHIRVKNVTVNHFKEGIYVRGTGVGHLFEDNVFTDTGLCTWPWYAHKATIQETNAIKLGMENGLTSYGHIVRNNSVTGAANGFSINTPNTDVYNNVFTCIADDAFEPDLVQGTGITENLRFWNNRIDQAFTGLSLSPIYGAVYFVQNTITHAKYMGVKNNLSPNAGPVLMWNNTFWNDYNNATHETRAFNIGTNITRYDVRNNIFYDRGAGLRYGNDTVPVDENTFDYNLWFSTNSVLWNFNGKNYSDIDTLQSSTGYEAHGVSADPLVVDPSAQELSLSTTSSAIDKGELIPGFHCAVSDDSDPTQKYCFHWAGSSPNIGASQ